MFCSFCKNLNFEDVHESRRKICPVGHIACEDCDVNLKYCPECKIKFSNYVSVSFFFFKSLIFLLVWNLTDRICQQHSSTFHLEFSTIEWNWKCIKLSTYVEWNWQHKANIGSDQGVWRAKKFQRRRKGKSNHRFFWSSRWSSAIFWHSVVCRFRGRTRHHEVFCCVR